MLYRCLRSQRSSLLLPKKHNAARAERDRSAALRESPPKSVGPSQSAQIRQGPENNWRLSIAAAATGFLAIFIVFVAGAERVGIGIFGPGCLVHDPHLVLLNVLAAGRRRVGLRDNGTHQQRCREHRQYQKPDRKLRHASLL